jgi:hypothetical protein
MERNTTWPAMLSAVLVVTAVACEAKKSSNPLSPSVAGPIPGVEITSPRALLPAAGAKLKESQQPVQLMIENASSTGVRPLYYTFEVATDSTFQTKLFARGQVPPGDNGRTSIQIDRLELGRNYYWRARAEDGANSGPFVSLQFEVLPRPVLQPPVALSPVNNEVLATNRPTLRLRASDRNSAVGRVMYEFQIAQDGAFTQGLIAADIAEAGGETSFTPATDLAAGLQYFWRARASDVETTSAWMAPQGFRTPPGAGGGGGGGGGGGSAPCGPPYPNNGPDVVRCVASKYPERLRAGVSLSQRIANMEFLRDRVIETGICGGMDLAWNKKRGTGPHSTDAIAWRTKGRDEVVDIGAAYDDTSRALNLMWHIVAGPPGYDPYPRPSCQ